MDLKSKKMSESKNQKWKGRKWVGVTSLAWETSSGLISQKVAKETSFEIGICDETSKGWFEFYDIDSKGEDFHAEGGLWFKEKELIDYDGVFELPETIFDKLGEMGYDVDTIRGVYVPTINDVPSVTELDLTFPTHQCNEKLLKYAIEQGFHKTTNPYNRAVSTLFFNGGSVIKLNDVSDEDFSKVMRYFKALIGSYAPKHENKTAECAWLLSLVAKSEIIKDS